MLNALTAVSFFVGLGLVLLVVLLGLLRIVWGLHLWVPAVGVTVCCLIIGAILMDPSRGRSPRDGAVAFADFEASAPEESDGGMAAEENPKEEPSNRAMAVAPPVAAAIDGRPGAGTERPDGAA